MDGDRQESERVSTLLAHASHTVLQTKGLDEAAEALELERFDAVLLGTTVPPAALADFTARLRHLDERQRVFSRTAVLSISGFALETLAEAVGKLSVDAPDQNVRAKDAAKGEPAIFAADEFREQCGEDRDFMAEIINLFLAEQEQQLLGMCDALAAEQYDRLAVLAHTLKGSLGALRAKRGQQQAQVLELAAKQKRGADCQDALPVFGREIGRAKTCSSCLSGPARSALSRLLH